jgi:hypothetical protein
VFSFVCRGSYDFFSTRFPFVHFQLLTGLFVFLILFMFHSYGDVTPKTVVGKLVMTVSQPIKRV